MPGPSLADRIEQLSAVDAFSPPTGFAAQARVRDPGDYARAAADGPAWWAEQARQRLDWHTPFSAVLDDSNPPFYTWFADGTLNVSYNCLDRHVLAGRGNRVAFHWRGEEGEERDVTYAELLAQVQRLASGLKARGIGKGDVVGPARPPGRCPVCPRRCSTRRAARSSRAAGCWCSPSRGRACCGPSTGTRTGSCRPTSRGSARASTSWGTARRDTDGYFWITGRVDDVINVSGHRLSTAEIESALVAHPAVAEAAVIATRDELTGQAVVAYVTLGQGSAGGPALEAELRDHIAVRIGKLARPRQIIWAEDLPKTRSGKIMRRLLRDIAEGREPGDVTTLRDTSVLDALQRATTQKGRSTS
jgi:hypothetical protein